LKTTVLFVEIPTNPDMKVPDITKLATMCQKFKKEADKEVILFVDTTFAPASNCMGHIK
jgi:cystathionine beta-lyase/cystathionine gamma-synthase